MIHSAFLRDARRICVIGTPASGKSWIASRIAEALVIPHVELDQFKWRADGSLAPSEEIEAGIRAASEEAAWVLDGNWSANQLADEAWGRADAIIWVDYPRWQVMRQALARSAYRVVTRHRYYGHTERFRDWLSATHPIRWSWSMTSGYRERYEPMLDASHAPHVRLRTRRAAHALVESVVLWTRRGSG